MDTSIHLFGIPHLVILAVIASTAAVLTLWVRKNRGLAGLIRLNLGAFLLVNEVVWYVYNLAKGWVHFPYGLPLDLCDIVVWLTILAAFTLKPRILELSYYWGLAGSSMAILTPDLGVPLNSYPTLYFFLAHGGVVIINLFLICGKVATLKPGSIWRAFLWLNVYAVAIGVFNTVFRTNYFYLCEKPANASLLDYMGPWPFYILSGELVGLIVFYLLSLPFRKCLRQEKID